MLHIFVVCYSIPLSLHRIRRQTQTGILPATCRSGSHQNKSAQTTQGHFDIAVGLQRRGRLKSCCCCVMGPFCTVSRDTISTALLMLAFLLPLQHEPSSAKCAAFMLIQRALVLCLGKTKNTSCSFSLVKALRCLHFVVDLYQCFFLLPTEQMMLTTSCYLAVKLRKSLLQSKNSCI